MNQRQNDTQCKVLHTSEQQKQHFYKNMKHFQYLWLILYSRLLGI